jgi:hypothetical protein
MNDLDRDVLRENLGPFENDVFRKTLSTARRVQRTRSVVRYGTPLVLALCAAALLWFPQSPESPLASIPAINATAPQAEKRSTVVTFRSKEFAGVLRTQPLRPDQTVQLTSRALTVSRTADFHPEINRINDDQLLALFRGKAVALIGRGADAKLVFPAEPETK